LQVDLAEDEAVDKFNGFLKLLMEIIEPRCTTKLVNAYPDTWYRLLLLGVLANRTREDRNGLSLLCWGSLALTCILGISTAIVLAFSARVCCCVHDYR